MDYRESLTEQLFGEALEVSREGRSALLEKACRGEPELRRAVEALLAENDRLSGFLSDSHQKAIIHRGLKPSNILVTEVDVRSVPKIIDFGVAKALD
jgi:eukaryotic-like serine/threonine-protein kinase